MKLNRHLATLLGLIVVLAGAGCAENPSRSLPDHSPPEIISTWPPDGSLAVPVDAELRVEFSEAISPTELTTPPLVVLADDVALPGSVELSASGTSLSFRPDDPFPPYVDFELGVMTGISDLAGNARREEEWTRFSTGIGFRDVGRVFVANEISTDISVFDLPNYDEAPSSPIHLGVRPIRMRAAPEEGSVYVLYFNWRAESGGGGVLVVDARTLVVLRDSGPILPRNVADLDLSLEDDRVLVVSGDDDALFLLAAADLQLIGDPIHIHPSGSEPSAIAVSRESRMALVGLRGVARVAAYHLPSMQPVEGFPVTAAPGIHTIAVDEARRRAWVGGRLRYSVVDLINPLRSVTLEMPQPCAPVSCDFVGMCRLVLDPVRDRVYMLDRRNALTAVMMSSILTAPESPGSVPGFNMDLAVDPRTGNLIVLGLRNLDSPLRLVDPLRLEEISQPMPTAGDKGIELEILP